MTKDIGETGSNLLRFFKDERSMYCFALIMMDGEKRNKIIGLTDELYDSKDLATKWYHRISKIIMTGSDDNDDATQAFYVLKHIYDILIEEDIEE